MKLLITLALLALAVYGLITNGSAIFLIPGILAVLYGYNGSVFVETPHIKQDGDEEVSMHWSSKTGKRRTPYINQDGKTYEMTQKGWRYNWFKDK